MLKVYNYIKESLSGITDDHGKKVIKTIDFFNSQTSDPEGENAFYLPAVFVEFQPVQWQSHTLGVQSANIDFVLHIVTDSRKATLEKAAEFNLQLCNRIHAQLHGCQTGGGVNSFVRTGSFVSNDTTEFFETLESYRVFVKDDSAVTVQQFIQTKPTDGAAGIDYEVIYLR